MSIAPVLPPLNPMSPSVTPSPASIPFNPLSPSAVPSPASAPSTLKPADYANQWCNTLLHEPSECQRGASFAAQALQTQSPSDVINQCTDFSGTEAYRYGCYLTTVFSGPSSNLCTTQLNVQGTTVPFAFPCASSCNTTFSDSGQADTCSSSAQYMFNQLVQDNGQCGTPAFSCVDGLNQTGSSYNCANNKGDRTSVCLPSVVGCTLGGLESQMLGQIQKYQQSQSQPSLSCSTFLYSDQPDNPQHPSHQHHHNNNDNWNPWPEGPTYIPNDGNGGHRGDKKTPNVQDSVFRL